MSLRTQKPSSKPVSSKGVLPSQKPESTGTLTKGKNKIILVHNKNLNSNPTKKSNLPSQNLANPKSNPLKNTFNSTISSLSSLKQKSEGENPRNSNNIRTLTYKPKQENIIKLNEAKMPNKNITTTNANNKKLKPNDKKITEEGGKPVNSVQPVKALSQVKPNNEKIERSNNTKYKSTKLSTTPKLQLNFFKDDKPEPLENEKITTEPNFKTTFAPLSSDLEESHSEQILNCISNLNTLLKQQSSSGSSGSTNFKEEDIKKIDALNSQLNTAKPLSNEKGNNHSMYRNQKMLSLEIDKDNITNSIYINSDNRIIRYKMLFNFIKDSVKDINVIISQSVQNFNLSAQKASPLSAYNNYNGGLKQVSRVDTSPNIEYLKTDANDPNNLSLLKDQSMERIEEVTSILTVVNSSKTKINIHQESNCDFDSDLNEFENRKESKKEEYKESQEREHERNVKKEIPSLRGYNNICKGVASTGEGGINSCVPTTKIVYGPVAESIHSICFDDDKSSFLRINVDIPNNKKDFGRFLDFNEEFKENNINVSPIRTKHLIDDSIGILMLNSVFEEKEREEREEREQKEKKEKEKEKEKEREDKENLDSTIKIEYEGNSDKTDKIIEDMDATVKEHFSRESVMKNKKITFNKALKSQDVNMDKIHTVNPINYINQVNQANQAIQVNQFHQVNPSVLINKANHVNPKKQAINQITVIFIYLL